MTPDTLQYLDELDRKADALCICSDCPMKSSEAAVREFVRAVNQALDCLKEKVK